METTKTTIINLDEAYAVSGTTNLAWNLPATTSSRKEKLSCAPYTLRINYGTITKAPHNNFMAFEHLSKDLIPLGESVVCQPLLVTQSYGFSRKSDESKELYKGYSSEFQSPDETIQIFSLSEGEKKSVGSYKANEVGSLFATQGAFTKINFYLLVKHEKMTAIRKFAIKQSQAEYIIAWLSGLESQKQTIWDKEAILGHEEIQVVNKEGSFVFYKPTISLAKDKNTPEAVAKYMKVAKDLRDLIYAGELYKAAAETGLIYNERAEEIKELFSSNKEETPSDLPF